MFSLQKILGQSDKFFDLLEGSAREAHTSVDALVKLLASPNQTVLAHEFIQSRRKEKELRAQISEAICTSFVTALEREDIESLADALYKIPKGAEKFATRLLLTPQHVQGLAFPKQTTLLGEAASNVKPLTPSMRLALLLPAAGTLFLGIFPSWLLEFASRSVSWVK